MVFNWVFPAWGSHYRMLSAVLIALREGVEAALVVGIVLVYLGRTGRAHLTRYVWSGLGAACLASLAGAVAISRWKISADGFDGVLMLFAAVLVVTMIVWMNRVARHLKKEIEQRVEALAQKTSFAAGMGLAVFVFFMVVREGVELTLILRAVEVSSEGVGIWVGTSIGLALAVAVGLFFFKGTLRIPLGRFFAATSVILMIVAFQLALTGVHELSEARWIASSRQEMAVIGPIVRHELFFFVFILGAAMILVLREWVALSEGKPPLEAAANPAEKRRFEWERRTQRRWMFLAAAMCLLVVLTLTADFVYTQASAAAPDAKTVLAQGGSVSIPVTEVADGKLHFFSVDAGGTVVRFLIIRKPDGHYATALDACMICGPIGYYQDGQNVICRNCAAPVYIPSIGEEGGCNPVSFPSREEGGTISFALSSLTHPSHQGHH
jgi:FTR1 family protein